MRYPRPDLFEGFEAIEGALTMSLARSLRCPKSVTTVAEHVKDTCGVISPAEDREGKAFLVRYKDMNSDIFCIVKTIVAKKPHSDIRIVARKNQTVEDILGLNTYILPKLGCPSLNHILRAVIAFRQGKQSTALADAREAINLAAFDKEGVSDEELKKYKVDPFAWKSLAVHILLSVNKVAEIGNIYDWQVAAGKVLDAEMSIFDFGVKTGFVAGKIKPKKCNQWDIPAIKFLPQPNTDFSKNIGVPVQTVHSVKGETHDVTIFVCPPTDLDKCPSTVWWSSGCKDREEKRIAYVAMTRSRADLIVCVSEDCFQRLTDLQPQFVAGFSCMTADEYVAMLNKNGDIRDIRSVKENKQYFFIN